MTTTTERVVQILIGEGGYRELPQPLKIGSLDFKFDHSFVGGDRSRDLVVLIEIKGDTSDELISRNILSLTRALDVQRSKRSVTAILTSGQPSAETVQSISRVCRVLPIGAPSGPEAFDAVRDWLSVLLPLREPAPADSLIDWEAELRKRAVPEGVGSLTERLIQAAGEGQIAVEEEFAAAIRATVSAALGENEDDN
jgi:hypothetical protein